MMVKLLKLLIFLILWVNFLVLDMVRDDTIFGYSIVNFILNVSSWKAGAVCIVLCFIFKILVIVAE